MRNALRTSSLPFFAAPVVIAAAAGLCIVACSSSSPRAGFDDATADGGDGGSSGPGFQANKDAGPPPSCATAEANAIKPPVDFIFVIDQSGSMTDKVSALQSNINNLAGLLQKSGLDYRVVMIAGKSGSEAVCVPPPLGGPGCASNGNVFRAVDQHIESWDALKWTLETLKSTGGATAWRDFLREDALKVYIPITDDRAGEACGTPPKPCSGKWFDANLLSLGGTLFGDDTKRKYVAYPIIGNQAFPSEAECATAASSGTEYMELAKLTGGKWFPVCSIDFNSVFQEISKTVNAAVACELAIPTVEGQELDPNHVNVKIKKADGSSVDVLQDNGDCSGGADGWQYSADGKKIVLCGQTCESVKASPDDKVTVEFGCQTKVK